MIVLTSAHIVYLALIIGFIVLMLFRKSIVVPCAAGILLVSYLVTGSILNSLQALFNTLVWAGRELFGIIVVIALIVAMSKALREIGSDRLIVRPLRKIARGRSAAFFVIGAAIFLVSVCIWPSPADALVGPLLLPIAAGAEIPPLWAAVVMNLFGHGMALSGDFFIQGAPTITAKAAGTGIPELIAGYFPLWVIMSVTVVTVAFLMFRRDMRRSGGERAARDEGESAEGAAVGARAVCMAVLAPAAFVGDAALMLARNLQGGDATALIGGTAFVVLILADLLGSGMKGMLEKVEEHIQEGFAFGIKIFVPVVVIGGFFFLGAREAAQAVYGAGATGFLSDIGGYLAQNAPLSKFPVVLAQAAVSVITGLDGSGFAGLPLIGATAGTFSEALPINKEMLAGMGQILTIWIGGGTVIPWAVIPAAAICDVSPLELVRKNLIPVFCGIAAVVVATLILA